MDVAIETMAAQDWPAVRRIFEAGIRTADATFETSAPDWPEWDKAYLPEPRLVGRDGGEVVGWAALARVSQRKAYAGVAEISIYVDPPRARQGIGRRLLGEIIACSERAGIWTLQAGIFPENAASLALHASLGFRTVGVRERIGQLHGVWRDVVLLERRSPRVG